MTIRPTRVTTVGRDHNWGFRVLGSSGEVLASRWGFHTAEAARQAGVAASIAISPTSISVAMTGQRVNRDLPQQPKRSKRFAFL